LAILEGDVAAQKSNVLVVRILDSRGKPVKDENVKVFRMEKNATLEQYAENLKNGSPFKRLMLSVNSDNEGKITADLVEGNYEIKVEKIGSIKVCELTQNEQVDFNEPKKHWW
jgi:hypothetical protein